MDVTKFDPAALGVVRSGGGWALGGDVDGYGRLPVAVVARLRELLAIPHAAHPPMPVLAADASDSAIQAAACQVWRAVRHRQDGTLPAVVTGWAQRTTRELVGAIRVWLLRTDGTVSLHALAASRWDGLYDWSGVRPRKPVAVMGRANDRDIEAARVMAREAAARLLPRTPAAVELQQLRTATELELRKVSDMDAQLALVESQGPRAAELRARTETEAAEQLEQLSRKISQGHWIWTCRKPAA